MLTRSPATMPWFVAPSVTAASPVRTPARAWIAGPEAPDRVDELERRPDGPLGVVLVGGRRAPDGHHRVADELLDRAAVAADDVARPARSSGVRSSRTSSASRPSAKGREADEVGEQDVTRRRSGWAWHDSVAAGRGAATLPSCGRISGAAVAAEARGRAFGVPHTGQATSRGAPQAPQKRRPASLAVPQAEQTIRTSR